MTENNGSVQRGRGRPVRVEPETDAVRRVRDALGMTQQELAEAMPCSLSAIRTMERDNRLPGSRALRENFAKLARRAGVEVPA